MASSSAVNERYGFVCDYFDPVADLVRKYQLIYYPGDRTVEMHDLKNKRPFLKRSELPGVELKDLYVGALITVYSRQLKVVEYADELTRSRFEKRQERTLAMIKPDAYESTGKIMDAIYAAGFTVGRARMFRLGQADAEAFYAVHRDRPFYRALVDFMTSDYVTALELIAENAVARWRSVIGPTSSEVARAQAPTSIRGRFGKDGTRNAVHGSDSVENAQKEIDFFFGAGGSLAASSTATFSNCALCLVKPHAVAAGQAGKVVDALLEDGFEVSALQVFTVDRANAEDFLEVYKGVVGEYQALVDQLYSGPCLALEVRAESAVQALRELAGPHDPEIARIIRPKSLRARFGLDKVRNAVHVTDLPDDGVLESEFFFNLLARKATSAAAPL